MKSLIKLFPFLKPQVKLILLSVLLTIPLSMIRMSPAPLIQIMTDSILVKKDHRMLILLPIGVVGLFVLNLFVRFGQAYSARLANERIMRDVREQLFRHYLKLSSGFFTETMVGKLIARVTNDVFFISHATISFVSLLKDSLTFTTLFIYAAYLNVKLLAITLFIVPVVGWIVKRTSQLMKGYSAKMQEANAWVFSALQEAFSGIKVIQAFGLERKAFERYKEKNDDYVKFALKAARIEEFTSPSVELLTAIAVACILYFGGREVIAGRLTQGEFIAFFTSFGLMINPLRTLSDVNMKLSQAAASADRVDETLQIVSPIVEKPQARSLSGFKDKIVFQNVGFSYHENAPTVFGNISFEVKKGQTLAIVGGSGQGKSTLVQLLPRFYDPTRGQIQIDDVDHREFTLASLRAQMAFVSQDVFLFNDTIWNNVSAGAEEATTEAIMKALELSHSLPFIEKLPQGVHTTVGDRGQKLSGGERQRLSIARAILKNAPILILDEATSSLDSESEKAVQAALETLMAGRTTLMIAHRLSTIKNADCILLLSGGQILEKGTHDQLMEHRGEYARYYQLLQG